MKWTVICKAGKDDNFLADLKPYDPRLIMQFDDSLRSRQVENNVLQVITQNGLQVDETIIDLLHFAMSVYTADLRIERNFAKDKWSREITLELPVVDLKRWEKTSEIIASMLAFLTGDRWTIRLRERQIVERPPVKNRATSHPNAVTLFSGGLDSFAGAIDLLENSRGLTALVGHYGRGSTNPRQVATAEVLKNAYPGQTLRLGFYVQPTKPGERSTEDTMRSRSILFLALGTAIASACGENVPLYVSENGLISLNIPLTYTRMGSLSTRTTHPYFMQLYMKMLEELEIDVPILLPYKFHTKGEMLRNTRNQEVLSAGLPGTLSCARPERARFAGHSPGTHCGYCVPCIIRLSSMKAAGFDLTDAAYFDVVNEDPKPTTVPGGDSRAFKMAIERMRTLSPLELVGEVLQSGPLSPDEINQFKDVYVRGLNEVASFLQV